MTTLKHDPMMIGLVLIVGAMMYSRQAKAQNTGIVPPRGTGSMPGSAGTGASQVIGGLMGSLANLFKTPTTQSWTTYNPMKPSEGTSYDPANPGAPVPLQDLVNGSISDIFSGDASSYAIPTNQDIFSSVTGYGSDDGSLVRVPGAYW